MINGISGKPGGGKSYEAVATHIINVVTKEKRKVVTNLPLNIDHFVAVYGEYCRDLIEVIDGQFHNYGGERPFSKRAHYEQYENWENEKGQKVYFFIDECHLAMPSQGCEKELTEFFSMHRHYGFDIMLITQNFRKVNRDIKDMVQNHYRCIKNSMIGNDDRYTLKVHDGASSSVQSVVATHQRKYDKKIFPFYQSHTKSEKSIQEAQSNDIQKWYKHWTIKASILFFVFAIFLLNRACSSLNEKQQKSKKNIEQKARVVELNQINLDVREPIKQEVQVEKPKKEDKTKAQIEYEDMVKRSKNYHPFHKVDLTISGHAEYTELGHRVHVHYFSANQNGQHIFTIKTADLVMAGYDLRILGECAVRVRFYEYEEYITCNSPTQKAIVSGSEQLAKANF